MSWGSGLIGGAHKAWCYIPGLRERPRFGSLELYRHTHTFIEDKRTYSQLRLHQEPGQISLIGQNIVKEHVETPWSANITHGVQKTYSWSTSSPQAVRGQIGFQKFMPVRDCRLTSSSRVGWTRDIPTMLNSARVELIFIHLDSLICGINTHTGHSEGTTNTASNKK